jgi:cytochrome c oxidase subunit II
MFSLFEPRYPSNMAQGVDLAFYLIYGISIFLLVAMTVVILWFVIRYNRKRHPKAVQIREHTWLEITWTVIPTAIAMVMFYYGYIAFTPMHNPPKDAMVVKVTGRMWVWEFEYPGNRITDTLMLPVNKPVKLELFSPDVVHSLFIPAFRIKEDVVPGRHNSIWFIPTLEGTYEILCTEYCGLRHSYMEAKAIIVPQAQYDKWLAALPLKGTTEPEGLTIMKSNACLSCHTFTGQKLVGPSLKDIFGRTVTVVQDGKTVQVTADSTYILTSILDPNKQVVEGFNPGLMKSYKGVIPDKDIQTIYQFLKTQHAK